MTTNPPHLAAKLTEDGPIRDRRARISNERLKALNWSVNEALNIPPVVKSVNDDDKKEKSSTSMASSIDMAINVLKALKLSK